MFIISTFEFFKTKITDEITCFFMFHLLILWDLPTILRLKQDQPSQSKQISQVFLIVLEAFDGRKWTITKMKLTLKQRDMSIYSNMLLR